MKIVADTVNGCDYLTAGKPYTVIHEHPSREDQGIYDILSDTGLRITVLKKDCPHTQSDWHIVDTERLVELSQVDVEEKEEKQYDSVENPKHYQLLPGVEFKDVRRAILDKIPEGVPYTQIDDWSRVFEYVGRMWDKNGLEDAKKARVYLNWLIEKMEEAK